MILTSIEKLRELCETTPARLSELDEDTVSYKTSPEKWSKKEILGHLIDSATNNHHRFIRAQFEDVPSVSYNQNLWNQYSFYQQMTWKQLVSFWTSYNCQLLELIQLIPSDNWKKECSTGGAEKFSLEAILRDYVQHLQHHLHQILQKP